MVFLVVFLADLFGMHTNPYMGILFFLILPSIFLVGLVLIPLGAWIERRRRARGLPAHSLTWLTEPGTPEARLYTDFLRPRDWADEAPTALWL